MSAAATIAARRREAETRFAAEGLPHRRIEAWHYTDLRRALPDDLVAPAPWDGAVVREGVSIGAGARVGAGAAVAAPVAAGITVVGVPARPMEDRAC